MALVGSTETTVIEREIMEDTRVVMIQNRERLEPSGKKKSKHQTPQFHTCK